MTITHAYIKQVRDEKNQKHKIREDELREVSRKVLVSYTDSLELPSKIWHDSAGAARNYVSVGFINERGLFQPVSFSELTLDENLKFKFVINTMIDGFSNGASCRVTISIFKEVGAFHVDIGKDFRSIKVVQPEASDAFEEVSTAIKEAVISLITDPRLDW